ncbi:MAG: DUF167 family protein [Steroidobacteraceae bacterium]
MTSPTSTQAATASWQGDALVINVQVQPGAARDEIVGLHGDRIKIRIAAPPVDGRANEHLIGFLAACCGTRRAAITIQRGLTGRAKTVRIVAPTTIPAVIADVLAGS